MTTSHELFHEVAGPGRQLRAAIPRCTQAISRCPQRRWARAGVLPARFREVIALAIAVTTECDGCIAAHPRGAARQGATAREVAEALGVAIAMNGGPGTVRAPRAYVGFREFAGESSGWCGRIRKRTAAALTGPGGIIHCTPVACVVADGSGGLRSRR